MFDSMRVGLYAHVCVVKHPRTSLTLTMLQKLSLLHYISDISTLWPFTNFEPVYERVSMTLLLRMLCKTRVYDHNYDSLPLVEFVSTSHLPMIDSLCNSLLRVSSV